MLKKLKENPWGGFVVFTFLVVGLALKPVKAAAPDVKFPYVLDERITVHCDKNTGIIIYESVDHGGVTGIQRYDICHP